jgi:PST family polysaccharide transporter
VAAGYALAPALSWPLSFWWMSRVTTVPIRALVHSAVRILTVLVAVALAAWITGQACGGTGWWSVAAAVAGGLTAFALICGCVGPMRRDAAVVVTVVRQALRRHGGADPRTAP